MKIIAAHKYVSPRHRPLTTEEADARRIAYALKIPTYEACTAAARDLAPLLDAAEHHATALVLMPVPTSTGSIHANRQFANALAAELRRRYPTRRTQIKITVGRKHPVESSCARRLRGLDGLTQADHVMVRLVGPLTATGTAYYFVDNMATTGTTLAACRHALGFGDAAVWADAEKSPRLF
jgi:predicted amidophosphoribosyltransferase